MVCIDLSSYVNESAGIDVPHCMHELENQVLHCTSIWCCLDQYVNVVRVWLLLSHAAAAADTAVTHSSLQCCLSASHGCTCISRQV